MNTVFVTGAAGFIGTELCEQLTKKGYQVKALKRSGKDTKYLDSLGVNFIEGDLLDTDSLTQGIYGADAIFHLAALYREAKFGDEMYWKVNFEGTKNLLLLAAANKVKKFYHCSTTGVLGNIEDPPADETYRYGPLDTYQESKTEAEKYVLDSFSTGVIKGAVIRPAMVWGPRDTRLLKLYKGVARRTLPIIGSGNTWCHWVLARDVAKAFCLAYENERSHGQLYTAAGEKPVSLALTMQKIAEFYKVKLLPVKIPAFPIQVAGTIVEMFCKPFGIEPPLHRRRVDFFVKNRCFDCSKIANDLGYKPTYTFEEEVKLTCQWYLDNGWI